jgi:hypothetical protein
MLFGATDGDVIWLLLALVGFAAVFIIIAIFNFLTSADPS